MKMYNLIYGLGEHHLPIVVPELSFYKVVDDLSIEFEIFKSSISVPDDSDVKKIENYNIINYWGDEQVIGFVTFR